MQEAQAPPAALILLATHNGEPWLGAQLESLLAQDYDNLHIVIRDDASSDATAATLESFRARSPDRISVLDNNASHAAGIRANFTALMRHALTERSESHMLFCDQDDIWHRDKLSTLLAVLPDTVTEPGLAYSEMRVVDASGIAVADSFSRYQKLSPQAPLQRLLVQNHVSGCACLFNRAALELAWPLPPEALMHDWWLALVTACLGDIRYCERPLLDYRQHTQNAVGARGYGGRYLWQRASGDRGTGLEALYRQALALQTRLTERGHALPPALGSFLATRGLRRLQRWRALRTAGHTRSGVLRNLPLWLA